MVTVHGVDELPETSTLSLHVVVVDRNNSEERRVVATVSLTPDRRDGQTGFRERRGVDRPGPVVLVPSAGAAGDPGRLVQSRSDGDRARPEHSRRSQLPDHRWTPRTASQPPEAHVRPRAGARAAPVVVKGVTAWPMWT